MGTELTIGGTVRNVRTAKAPSGACTTAELVHVDRYRNTDGTTSQETTIFQLMVLGTTGQAFATLADHPGRSMQVDGRLLTFKGRTYIHVTSFLITH
jgi:hypothetical protein